MSECELPVGPVNIITKDFPPVPSKEFCWKGLGHLRLLPPSNLRYPLLAIKVNSQLVFTLCRTCTIKKSSGPCNHSDNERAITGTYTHNEIWLVYICF